MGPLQGSESISVLEVGAGDGELTRHLRSLLDPRVQLTATDSNARGLLEYAHNGGVSRIQKGGGEAHTGGFSTSAVGSNVWFGTVASTDGSCSVGSNTGSGAVGSNMGSGSCSTMGGSIVDSSTAGSELCTVECLDYQSALDRHTPHLIICSWMPLGDDWTEAFRKCKSVAAYLLLGEIDDGCCGDPWRTWGYYAGERSLGERSPGEEPQGGGGSPVGDSLRGGSLAGGGSLEEGDSLAGGSSLRGFSGGGGSPYPCSTSSTSSESSALGGDAAGLGELDETRGWRRVYEHSAEKTLWGAEGWRRREILEMSARQLCRTDEPWCDTRHSHAVVFERIGAA